MSQADTNNSIAPANIAPANIAPANSESDKVQGEASGSGRPDPSAAADGPVDLAAASRVPIADDAKTPPTPGPTSLSPEARPTDRKADVASTPPGGGAADPDTIRRRRRPAVFIIGALVLVVLALGGFYYWYTTLDSVSTDDAYTDGRVVAIAPQVSGLVVSLDVTDNQYVRKGDPLIHIDPRPYTNDRNRRRARSTAPRRKRRGNGIWPKSPARTFLLCSSRRRPNC